MASELERKADHQKKGLRAELGKDILFAEAARKWLGQLSREYRSKRVAQAYLEQRIIPLLGDKPCRSISREDVRAMLLANEEWREGIDLRGKPIKLKPAAAATREKLRAYVHAIFEYLAEDLEVVTGRNPAGGKRMRVKTPKRLPRFIPVSELVPLLKHIPDHYRLLFVFGVVTGVRKGELIPLTWSDVRLEERYAIISKSQGFDSTKGNRERLVPIPLWLIPLLADEKAKKWSQLVFPSAKGKMHRFDVKLIRVMRTAAKEAGLVTGYTHICRRQGCGWREELADPVPAPCPKCSYMSWVEPIPKRYQFRDLRSTFGTLAASQSGDIRFVQQALGHASVKTTEDHYARALTADLVRRADKLSFGLEGTVRDL